VPPAISSLTPDPKFRRSIYRSVKDINERLERALAAVLDRTGTSGELLRTASQVRELRSRNTSFRSSLRNIVPRGVTPPI